MLSPAALFGVVGYPLAHSMSPALHNWGFSRVGISAVYMAWPVPSEKLADFFVAVRTLPIRGGNITLPHKVASMALLDTVSTRAKSVGAVNVFFWEGGRLHGDNTDVTGFLAPIRNERFTSALVLGAGGASRAVVVGLKELGVPDIAVSNRSANKAEALAKDFGLRFVPWDNRASVGADCVINTTSVGMKGERVAESPFPQEGFTGRGLAYDIIYNPLETRFLADARAAGWKTQDGLAMFVEQARESFRLWHKGADLPAEEAAALIKQTLAL